MDPTTMIPPSTDSTPTGERILVCVSPSPASAHLIHEAHQRAEKLGATWMAVTVDAPDAYGATAADRQRLLAHLRLAESLGAETMRLSGRGVCQELLHCARQHAVTRILVGKPTLRRWRDRFRPSLVHELLRDSGSMEVQFIAAPEGPASSGAPSGRETSPPWHGYLVSAGLVILTTLLAHIGRQDLTPPDLVMLYLLPIMLVAHRYGQREALLTSALSVAAYDFFFVNPHFTFSVSDSRHLLTFVILFLVGIVISGLMNHIRRQASEARERERQADALYRLGREAMETLDDVETSRIVTRHGARLMGGGAALYLSGSSGTLERRTASPDDEPLPSGGMEVLSWSLEHGQVAGWGTAHFPHLGIVALPLQGSRVRGAMMVRPEQGRPLPMVPFLEAFARQSSLALDRTLLGEEARAAAIRAKSEELRSSLLSMASHDLRTPLAAITGAGTALRDEGTALDVDQRRELLDTLCIEAERMERLITNLLDLLRLESGGCHLHPEWIPFEELAGSAMNRLEGRCQGRRITVEVDQNLPLLHVDPVFFEQVLVNLLDNACKYTPPGSPLQWRMQWDGDLVTLSLRDHGAGIPVGMEERIFEKFTRSGPRGIPGSGLGLAICRGVVRAHGGSIQAVTDPDGGAVFHVRLPQPPVPPDILLVGQEGEGGLPT